MSNAKHYPLHPNATHPPIMTCEIPLEEYESLKRENAQLKGEIKRLENVRKVHIEGIESMSEWLKLDAKQICRLKRALYKACANWARSERYTEATWHGDEHREELWTKVQDKCRAKAEQYK